MTAAPGFIMSPVIRPLCPAATTRISACRVNSASFGVRLWQEITVPFARRSIMAMGFPTMLLRPTTVQTLPSTGIS